MSKIISAADACAIRKKHDEAKVEACFMRIMEKIGNRAADDNQLELYDTTYCAHVVENAYVDFLQAHPEQVERLINMGYKVEQEIYDREVINRREEYKPVKYWYFFSSNEYVKTEEPITVSIRKFTISWECKECDDK